MSGRMESPVAVDPFKCRMWALHDRLEENIDEKSCREEIRSFLEHGQLVPVLGRPLLGDAYHDVELIYGARRLFVATHLKMPLKVEIRQISDREAIVAMDIENRFRKDICPYERGMSYVRYLNSGLFRSQQDIAKALRISPPQVSRLIQLAKLPVAIINAFPSSQEICEGWGTKLSAVIEKDDARQRVMQIARTLAKKNPKLPGPTVFRRLVQAGRSGERAKPMMHDEVIRDSLGKPIFRIKHQRLGISFAVPIAYSGEAGPPFRLMAGQCSGPCRAGVKR